MATKGIESGAVVSSTQKQDFFTGTVGQRDIGSIILAYCPKEGANVAASSKTMNATVTVIREKYPRVDEVMAAEAEEARQDDVIDDMFSLDSIERCRNAVFSFGFRS